MRKTFTAKSRFSGTLDRVVITEPSGVVHDLGKPNSRLFDWRVDLYKIRRAPEFAAAVRRGDAVDLPRPHRRRINALLRWYAALLNRMED